LKNHYDVIARLWSWRALIWSQDLCAYRHSKRDTQWHEPSKRTG
jgi:hypothetical protein